MVAVGQGTFRDEFISVDEAMRQFDFPNKTELDRCVIKNQIPILKGANKYDYLIHRSSLWSAYASNELATLKRARPKRAPTAAEKYWAKKRGAMLPLWKKIWTKEGKGSNKKTVETQTYKKASKEVKERMMKNYEDSKNEAAKAKKKVMAERNPKKK